MHTRGTCRPGVSAPEPETGKTGEVSRELKQMPKNLSNGMRTTGDRSPKTYPFERAESSQPEGQGGDNQGIRKEWSTQASGVPRVIPENLSGQSVMMRRS